MRIAIVTLLGAALASTVAATESARPSPIREDVAGEDDFLKDPDANIRKELTKLLKPPHRAIPAKAAGKPAVKLAARRPPIRATCQKPATAAIPALP